MGILDTIKNYFQKTETTLDPKAIVASVRAAGQAQNYNQASLNAFYALEALGESHVQQKREPYITAREYAQILSNETIITTEEVEPIIHNFEIAKYSGTEVSSEDYSQLEQSLEVVAKKLRSGKASVPRTKDSKKRTPQRRGRTGAARERGSTPTKRTRKKKTRK